MCVIDGLFFVFFQRSLFVESMYVVKGEFQQKPRMDLRRWVLEKRLDEASNKYNDVVIPKKAGQSLTLEQWASIYDQMDDIEAAVEAAKNSAGFDKKFHLGGKGHLTISGKPYYTIQLRNFFVPKALHQKRLVAMNLEDIGSDLRPAQNGAVLPLVAFPRFKEIVQESMGLMEFPRCSCNNKKLCDFCSPYTFDIQQKIDQIFSPYPDYIAHQ